MQNNEQAIYEAIHLHFACGRRRIKLISYLIVSLLIVATCSLWQWSKAINTASPVSSGCNAFGPASTSQPGCMPARLVWAAYGQTPQVVLTLDQTEYQQGGQWGQLLVLGIAYKGMRIPYFGILLTGMAMP